MNTVGANRHGANTERSSRVARTAVEQHLIDLTLELIQAEYAKDEAPFERRLHPRLRFRRANGSIIGKPSFLKALTNRDNRNDILQPDDGQVAVQVFEDQAVTSVVVRFKGLRGGGSVDGRFRNTRTWIQGKNGEWQCAFWFNTALPMPPGGGQGGPGGGS